MNFNLFFFKKFFFFLSILYLTLFLPFLITIYCSSWYNFNYEKQEITKNISLIDQKNATENLVSFFAYNTNLNSLWNEKEISHMYDVRQIYFILELLALISIVLVICLFDKSHMIYCVKINIIFLVSLLIILPFFQFIFSGIFHEILFTNNNWIMTDKDISYYLFPLEFFRNSFLFIILISILENFLIFLISKKYN